MRTLTVATPTPPQTRQTTENFLMGKSGTLKLTDFGFARELEPEERLYSQFGTPEYVAPEVGRDSLEEKRGNSTLGRRCPSRQ